jgi:hypothetical protein
MIRNPAKALRSGIRDYLNRARQIGQRSRTRRIALEAIRNSYLEYAMGWKPLMSDIEAGCNAYSTLMARPTILRVYGKSEQVDPPKTATSAEFKYGNAMGFVIEDFRQVSYNVKYVGAVRVRYNGSEDDAVDEVRRLTGFSLLEFIPTAWELIPYSFVADYFANIGTILNSIPGLASDWVYVSKSARSVIH